MAALLALAVVAAVVLVLVGRSSPSQPVGRALSAGATGGSTPAASPSASSAPSTTTTTTTTIPAPTAPFPVGSTTVAVDDVGRQFTAQVFYPSTRSGAGATPLRQGGPWPLVVFSPGFDIVPAEYTALVEHWAQAGFVVAVADYPFTAPGPAGVNEADIVYHPADLRAVISDMLSQSANPRSLLAGTVNPARIGVAGHSDGGDVTDAVVANTCCRDPRIKAAAVLSGAELTSFGGTYGAPGVPLLVVQGDADQINPPACSEQIYDGAGLPRYYLDLHGAGHRAPYLDTGPYYASAAPPAVYQAAVDRATLLFWESYLAGDSSALSAFTAGGGLGPDASFTAGAPVALSGSCPGAPA